MLSLPLLALSAEYLFLLGTELRGLMSEPRTLQWLAVMLIPPGYIVACGLYVFTARRLLRAGRVRPALISAMLMLTACLATYYWLYSIFY